jgi:hypothetical protein
MKIRNRQNGTTMTVIATNPNANRCNMLDKADTTEQSNLGKKYDATPAEHLRHLLRIGWSPNSALIKKYIVKRGLQEVMEQYGNQTG